MRIAVLLAALGIVTCSLNAQLGIERTARIVGHYYGTEPCTAELREQQDGRVIADVPCGNDGRFEFTGTPQASYVVVTRAGNKSYERVVSVFATLNELDIYPDAKRAEPSATSIISIKELAIPDKAKKDVEKAKGLIARSDYEGATAKLTDALKLAPHYPTAMALQAAICLSQKDFADALRLSQQAADDDPTLALAQLTKASALNSMGRGKEAASAANEAIRLDGSSWQAHFELGRAFVLQHDLRSALGELNTAASNAPKNFSELYFVRAWVLAYLKDTDNARVDADKFAALSNNDPRLPRLRSLLKK